MNYEDMQKRALGNIEKNKNRVPAYPVVQNGLCEHCETFYSAHCPLHKPKSASTAVGMYQPIKTSWRDRLVRKNR